jgi:hypothetical protein
MKLFPDVCGVSWYLAYFRLTNVLNDIRFAEGTDDPRFARTVLRRARNEKDDLLKKFKEQRDKDPELATDLARKRNEIIGELGQLNNELDKLIKELEEGVRPADFMKRLKGIRLGEANLEGLFGPLYRTSFGEAVAHLRTIDDELSKSVDAVYEGKDPVPHLQNAKQEKDTLRDSLKKK